MPVHILPKAIGPRLLTRRELLAGLAAGALAAACRIPAAPPARRSVWALVADTHIHADEAAVARDNHMAANLRAIVAGIAATGPRGVLIDGDLALARGEPGDYQTLRNIVEPLRQAGIPLHLTLGNHDHRANLVAALAEGGDAVVEGKRVSALAADGIQWLFLDSLDVVNATPGSLGARQLAWIAARLDASPGAPTIVCVHHNPEQTKAGLQDTEALFGVLRPRRQAKAVLFGHTHVWRRWEVDGIHCLNLPAVGYVFQKEQPQGWVRAEVTPEGMEIELRSLDSGHPLHGRREMLAWRAG